MPKLAFLLSCERSIIEHDTQLISMIGLMTNIKVTSPEAPPVNAVTPKEWSIVTGWDGDEGDDGKEFTQGLDIFLPDGKPFTEKNQIKFKVQKSRRHHIATKLLGFPIGQTGKCQVQVWAEFDGKLVTEKSTLHIGVEHEIVKSEPAQIKPA